MARARTVVLAALVGIASLTSVEPLAAQPVPQLAVGQRVRVTAPSLSLNRSVATVESLPAHGVGLRVPRSHGAGPTAWIDTLHVSVSLDSLTSMDVSVREHGHGWAGAGLGMIVGALAGYAIGSNKTDMFEPASSILGGVLLGIPIGAFVGSNIRSDEWRPVDLQRLRVGLGARRGGRLRLGVMLAL